MKITDLVANLGVLIYHKISHSERNHLLALLEAASAMFRGTKWGVDVMSRAARVRVRSSMAVRRDLTLCAAALLVDLEGVDAPVGVAESRGVVLDVGVARAGVGGAAAGRPNVAGPVTAESDIKDLRGNISKSLQTRKGSK